MRPQGDNAAVAEAATSSDDVPRKLRAWVRAARPLAHGNIAPPILFGVALACSTTGVLDRTGLVLALIFGVLDHLVIVFGNDLADVDADRQSEGATLVSGGSRVLVDGTLSRNSLRMALRVAVGALLLFAGLASLKAPLLFGLALAALALLWLYSGAPVRASYRGGGALLQGLGVGVVLPLVGWSLQAPESLPSWLSLAPPLVLATMGNVLTAMPDAEGDRRAEKRNVASRYGVRVAAWVSALGNGIAIALGAALFASTPEEGQLLTGIPLLFLVPSLLLLRSIEDDRGMRLRFVLLGLGAGTSALLCWSAALL
jgi:1,4-dihydroxy-2-naphthoate octaprenyltransferase